MVRATDLFVRRPVLATTLSLLILFLGLRSFSLLPVREFPRTDNAVIKVTTIYTGADPSLVAGFITTPLETAVAQAEGIDDMTSTSTQGSSVITANLRLNYDPNKALTEVTTQVNSVLNQLPQGTLQPIISVTVGDTLDSMYIGFYSDQLATNNITDYLIRVVQPKLQSVDGVQLAEILGKRQFAMRVWMDPKKLQAYGLSAADVEAALASNNYISAAGRTDGREVTVNLTANTGLTSLEDFRNMIVRQSKGQIVRLEDVARVTLGAEDYDTQVSFDGRRAVYIGIKVAPTANLLDVVHRVRQVMPDIQQQLPEGLKANVVYDATKYVNSAIHDVVSTLVEALAIVTVVIFLFLGTLRSVVIPVIAMPLSLVGGIFIMLVLGYSINLMTLLALVLAIGLVVDDAIIVVENVHRHLEEGRTPFQAALLGARELAGPIIAISVVLIAVYVPIGFMGGLTGALFTEFAFTLAGTVAVSALIALTLSPMMCSKFLRAEGSQNKQQDSLAHRLDQIFHRLRLRYQRSLQVALTSLPVVSVFAVLVVLLLAVLFLMSKKELAPQEDQGVIITLATGAPNASISQSAQVASQINSIFQSFPEEDHVFQLTGVSGLNSGIAGMVFKPWSERTQTPTDLQPLLQAKLQNIVGAKVFAFQPPSLPGGGGGLPIQFVIQTTDDDARLATVSDAFMRKALATHKFMFLDNDLKYDKPSVEISLDRDRVAQLGLDLRSVGQAIQAALSAGYVNFFNLDGRSYKVIPQMDRTQRLNPEQLLDYTLTTPTGKVVQLSSLAHLKTVVIPESINHFQQLNSATISGMALPGVTMGDALGTLQKTAQSLPQGYSIDYGGQSRQFMQESNALVLTFFFALIIIFLALAAQFESFRDPVIIMLTVPLSICGAMIFIFLGWHQASLNIYSEVGLVTLIGLISKHGILIVEFANQLQRQGHSKMQAISEAAGIRLRPILMTTAAMVVGVIPLMTATGAGALGRYNIGLVIATGISIGTFFTLFVIPAFYLLLAEEHSSATEEARMNELNALDR